MRLSGIGIAIIIIILIAAPDQAGDAVHAIAHGISEFLNSAKSG